MSALSSSNQDNEMNTVELPFAGFYCSKWDAALDSEFDQTAEGIAADIHSATGEHPENGAVESALHAAVTWDHASVAEDYAKRFGRELVALLGLDASHFAYDGMVSPREYNFATDRVYLKLSDAALRAIWRRTRRAVLERIIVERHRSRSGFVSFYSDDLGDWPGHLSMWDANQRSTLLLAYLATVEKPPHEIEDEILENMRCNGAFSNAMAFDMDAVKAAVQAEALA